MERLKLPAITGILKSVLVPGVSCDELELNYTLKAVLCVERGAESHDTIVLHEEFLAVGELA